jgi:aminopeptidase N
MSPSRPAARAPVRRADYRPPDWVVDRIDLVFDLDPDATEVAATLIVRRTGAPRVPLRLDGEGLELLALRIDGAEPAPGVLAIDDGGLTLALDTPQARIETRVRIAPASNTALEGLYASGSSLLTQCEAEGFRRITYAIDRPDVMARYSTELRADRARFPVLLGNGDLVEEGSLPDGRHFARWDDPHPKPSYLFALVAGRLDFIEDRFTTAEGREVLLRVHADPGMAGRCAHAMDALKRCMRWDEQRYGRCYDLSRFNIVATHDFNMGAMENKGLNIFNAKFVLADARTSTDDDFLHVEAVVSHEYFHNWTGNRVTCRDWFQLSLKEGLTVFRDQQFVADIHSRAVRRIDDVRTLRAQQFAEDAGPFAHPVRPDEYSEINNFYTATVYEKGAEVVRMLHAALGEAGFRAGMDEYFRRHDGQAVTCDDFIAALCAGGGVDLSPFASWYAQAGTPRLEAHGHHDAATRRFVLTLAQSTPPTPGQPDKRALPIPVRLALFDARGRRLPLRLAGEAAPSGDERVLLFTDTTREFVFEDVDDAPVASLLRDFSAPVRLDRGATRAELAFLARHDDDPFNRWEAIQQLGELAILAGYRDDAPTAADARNALADALHALLDDALQDPAFVAECLLLPDENWLGEQLDALDPPRLHAAREALRAALGAALASPLARAIARCADGSDGLDARGRARRRLRNVALGLRVAADPAAAAPDVAGLLAGARLMTDRLTALALHRQHELPGADAVLAAFRADFADDALVLDKWFALEASNPRPATVERVLALMDDPAFSWRNPNKVRALLGTFARANRVAFHRADGAGYRMLADAVRALDALNPQVAARLVGALSGWRKIEPARAALMRAALEQLAALPERSRDLAEIVDRALA